MSQVANGVEVRVPELGDRTPGRRRRRGLVIAVGVVVLAVLCVWFATLGTGSTTVGSVVRAIYLAATGGEVPAGFATQYTVITTLRLPRILLAVVAGAALSLAGVVMQGVLRNPLVSPFTLGVSPAAAFGAALVILVTGGTSQLLTTTAAFVMAAGVSIIVLSLAHSKSGGQITATLLLLGIALTQLFEAATSALQFAADENTLAAIVRWTFGSVNEARWSDVAVVGAVTLVSMVVIVWKTSDLNAIAFAGDDAARSLGVNVALLRAGLISVGVLLAAVVVSFCGVIGFVGLVGPHIARLIIGADHRYLVPFSAVSGAALLVTADTVGRLVIAPIVVPVGIVIAVVGAPLFIYLILTRKTG